MKTKVIVDSSVPVHYTRVEKSIFRALVHFGVNIDVVDLSWSRIAPNELEDTHLLILAQEGIGKSLSKEETDVILKSVSQGMGIIVLDGYLNWYPASFLKELKILAEKDTKIETLKLTPENKITDLCEHTIEVKQPLLGFKISRPEDWSVLLSDQENNPSVIYKRYGKGKVIFFLVSASLWQNQYLGFGEGLDGVFRKSIAWASKKPYIMKSMPPFITAKFDDVSFSGSRVMKYKETLENVGWLDIMNRYGFIPNVALFLNDIQQVDSRRFREKEQNGLAEFSPHAFVDFRYMENQEECPIYLKHNGQEFTFQELKNNFDRVDAKFGEWGINLAKTLNVHYQEIGLNSLSFIKERGQKYTMTPIRLGKVWSDPEAHKWESPPYGKPGFSFGPMPEDDYFFNVLSVPPRKDVNVPTSDFLYRCTGLHKENAFNDVEKAIKRAVFQIKRGLETGFFGCFMTHEQRVAQLALEEWETIIKGIYDNIKNIPHIMKSYDTVACYAENRSLYEVEQSFYNKNSRELTLRLKGRTEMSQYLNVFTEEGEQDRESFLKIPEFEQLTEVSFNI
ncbi:hypothetical protein M0P98_03075 [bacterium]|nr:hypothetical protein [bacterium]